MSVKTTPQVAKVGASAREAWWYENKGSIHVLIRANHGQILSCKIWRKNLKDWLARTEPKKKVKRFRVR